MLRHFRERVGEGSGIDATKRAGGDLLREKELGLPAILALTGLSDEELHLIITLCRISDDRDLNEPVGKEKWVGATGLSGMGFAE